MSQNKAIKLLIVEDDEDDFFLLERSLKKSTFEKQIIWAHSFEMAVEILKTESVDIVIIDYRLGVHTGLELVYYINDNFPFTPTILLTGLKAQAIDEEALRSGVYDYLAKDQYTPEDIDRSIRYAVEKSKVLKSLKESEHKFKTLFENAVEYVFLVNSDLVVIDANKSALKLFNKTSKEEIIGADISQYISQNFFENDISTHSSVEIEFTIPELNRKAYCILNSSLIDSEKNIYQLVLHDITERKSNEQREKLLEKQALTGKVARIIAHEIKNPLTNIHLSLSELRAMLQDGSFANENPEDFLSIIERNGHRINILIEDLLNATRFETINFTGLRLDELLLETLSHIEDRLQLKKISVEKQINKELIVKGDKDKLVIALLNILVNAVEAIDEKTGRLKISTSSDDGNANITIADNGKGIPQEDLPKLFEPFFTSKKGGTGLGLAATYTIIAKHDGAIKVKSEVGKGTAFTITLPLKN
jgi:PAS domain S-box-containing protein